MNPLARHAETFGTIAQHIEYRGWQRRQAIEELCAIAQDMRRVADGVDDVRAVDGVMEDFVKRLDLVISGLGTDPR